jgi:uncharacterized membrane protein
MDLSLPGLIGAVVGTVVAWINYYVIIGFVTERLRAHDTSKTPAERLIFEQRLSWMRQLILALDIVIFGAIGYWLGATLGGG